MKLLSGKYHNTEIEEIPTDYLEWALVHMTLDDQTQQAIQVEISRRQNEQRVKDETKLDRIKERVSETVTKFAAKHGL